MYQQEHFTQQVDQRRSSPRDRVRARAKADCRRTVGGLIGNTVVVSRHRWGLGRQMSWLQVLSHGCHGCAVVWVGPLWVTRERGGVLARAALRGVPPRQFSGAACILWRYPTPSDPFGSPSSLFSSLLCPPGTSVYPARLRIRPINWPKNGEVLKWEVDLTRMGGGWAGRG